MGSQVALAESPARTGIVFNTLVKPRSSNRKLGPGVGTTYRQVGDAVKGEGTCPSKCPFLKSKQCYAMRHYVHMSAKRANGLTADLDALNVHGDKFVRLHTSGDFFCATGLDFPYINAVVEWCRQNPSVTVWTYTHGISILIEHGYVPHKLPSNLHIVASCDDDEEKALTKRRPWRRDSAFEQLESLQSWRIRPQTKRFVLTTLIRRWANQTSQSIA